MSQNNGSSISLRLKTGLAEMLKGGVIMDVTNAEQATSPSVPERLPSWRSNVSPRKSAPKAEWPAWPRPKKSARSWRLSPFR